MKPWLLGGSLFGAGVLCGLLVASCVADHAKVEMVRTQVEMLRFHAEDHVRLGLIQIDLAQAGRNSEVLRLNCRRVQSSMRLLEALPWDAPAEARDVVALRERARATVSGLKCPDRAATTSGASP